MCGIFGYSGKQPVDIIRLRYLATENQSRGDHSTGVYGNYLYKKALAAKEFSIKYEFEDAVNGAFNVIGHTRHATMGAKTDANAHPFEIFKSAKHADAAVVGTHNGMVFDTVLKKLVEKYKFESPDVDSQLIYQMLVELNFDYDEALSQIDGAMALAFIRPDHPDYLYLYHRTSRPLHIGYVGPNMYYSSESLPLWLIGCDTVEALETDQMFVFRKGALVEVSDVKKPSIVTIREDQTLSMWIANTATTTEKTALGLPGAHAGHRHAGTKTQGAIPFDQPYKRTPTPIGATEGGTKGNSGGSSEYFPGNTLQLLPKIPGYLYHYETLTQPSVGRFYHAGNNHSCYFVYQLVAAHDINVKLPLWFIKVKQKPVIHSLSAHNGIGVLEIPYEMCRRTLTLELHNPIQPGIVYEMPIHIGESGSVMEVALIIPFQETQEKVERLKAQSAGVEGREQHPQEPERLYNANTSFSKWLTHVASFERNIEEVCEQDRGVQESGGNRTVEFRIQRTTGSEDSSSGYGMRLLNPAKEKDNDFYNKETDILGMDLHTTGTTADEIELLKKKMRDALSSLDDSPKQCQEVLVEVGTFLEFLGNYFHNRYEAIEKHEQETENRCNC